MREVRGKEKEKGKGKGKGKGKRKRKRKGKGKGKGTTGKMGGERTRTRTGGEIFDFWRHLEVLSICSGPRERYPDLHRSARLNVAEVDHAREAPRVD